MLQVEAIAHKSPYKKLYPKTRLLVAILLVWIGTMINSPIYHMSIMALSIGWMMLYTRLSMRFFLGWLSPVLLFSGLALLVLPRSAAIVLFSRSIGNGALLLTIIFTIPMKHLMDVFKKVLPKSVSELLEICYRVIFVLMEVAFDMVRATSLRFGYNKSGIAIKSTINLSAILFIKTLDRAFDMEQALALRTFDEE